MSAAAAIPAMTTRVSAGRRTDSQAPVSPVLAPWVRSQAVSVTRHAAALRPFKREEFGTGPAAPSEGHIQAVNNLIGTLRQGLFRQAAQVSSAADAAIGNPASPQLQALVVHKDRTHQWVQAIEKIWDFYFELFGQRQGSQVATWLLGCDRIALDCYQEAYMGLGIAKSIPAPPPFSFMRTGFSPATFRRGILLPRLGRRPNPFPLIQLPYHRLVNPWTLGAILHETSHNFQTELGLSRAVPLNMARRLLRAGIPRNVAFVWVRWNREIFADLSGLLLGGPGFVASLMDTVGRHPMPTLHFSPRGVHPTPYLRVFISTELLRRMGFPGEAEEFRKAWMKIYPNPRAGNIPAAVLDTFSEAKRTVVDAICYQPYKELGNKALAQVLRFSQKEQRMTEEAARRLAAGTDPGIIPERFLIGAVRYALDERLARPGILAHNFYQELARR